MTIYRFKVSFEDYDVSREIDIRSIQTFEDLHRIIHTSLNYNTEVASSFYISNDQWIKGTEITILPNEKRQEKQVALMKNSRLNNFIEDPHQKFYYISNFDRPFDLHIELIRILKLAENSEAYPKIVKINGEAPKQFIGLVKPIDKASSVSKGKKAAAKKPLEKVIIHDVEDLEEEEEEEENTFSIGAIEEIEVGEHIELSLKVANEDGSDLDDLMDGSEIDEEFGDYGNEDHDDSGQIEDHLGDHLKDDY